MAAFRSAVFLGWVGFSLVAFILIGPAFAQSSKDQLDQSIAALQKNPDDRALRESIIRMALELNYNPEISGVNELLGKAKFFMKEAQSKEGYLKAAKVYEQAAVLAPWNANIYYNLGVLYEKGGKLKAALDNFRLYLLAAPTAKDRSAVEEKIGELMVPVERVEKEKSRRWAEKEKLERRAVAEAAEKAEQERKAVAKKTEIKKQINRKLSYDMVLIPAGEFWMGSKDGEGNEKPRHKVWLDDFLIDKYEVTFEQYDEFCEATKRKKVPDQWGRGTMPVINVTWKDAEAFCKWSEKRLPTEAEWEKAAKGKKNDAFKFEKSAWYTENSGNMAHPVGLKKANGYGLYDMAGNVWEWCSDWYGELYYSKSSEKNPKGPDSGETRVLRGGSWNNIAGGARPTYRGRGGPDGRIDYGGCRCAKTP